MKPFSRAVIDGNDVAAPGNIQEEMAEIAGIVNGRIDHDNLQDKLLTSAKVASGALQNIGVERTTASVVVSGDAETPTSAWFDVPGLSINTQTQDAFLQIETSGWFDGNATLEYPMVFAACIDGSRTVMGGPTSFGPDGHWWCTAEVPVGGGAHVVSIQFAHTDNPGLGVVNTAWERDFHARQLWVREVKR